MKFYLILVKILFYQKYKKLKSEEIKIKNKGDLVTSVDIDVENYFKKKTFEIIT